MHFSAKMISSQSPFSETLTDSKDGLEDTFSLREQRRRDRIEEERKAQKRLEKARIKGTQEYQRFKSFLAANEALMV
jgi:hypothetical protein